MPKRLVHDRWLFFAASLLPLAGVLMVGSASTHVGKCTSVFRSELMNSVWCKSNQTS